MEINEIYKLNVKFLSRYIHGDIMGINIIWK